MEKNADIFRRRKLIYTAVFLAVIVIFAATSWVTEFSLVKGAASFPDAAAWIAENLIPDQEALERLLEQQGLTALCGGRGEVPFLARPRRQEIFACLNRYRGLKL